MSHCFAFLDTNIFLHFRAFEEIDWPEVLDAERVTLVLSLPVMEELDEQKDQHRLSKIQNRAREALHKIEQLEDDADAVPLPEGVAVRAILSEADLDFSEQGLDRTVPDDRLVASCLAERVATPDVDVTLVTDDTTPRLKARRHGLRALSLSDEYRLSSALGEVEKETRRLKKRVQELEHQFPELELGLDDSRNQFAKFTLPRPVSLAEDEVRERIERAKEEHPKRTLRSEEADEARESSGLVPTINADLQSKLNVNEPSPREKKRYNDALEEYYESVEHYWQSYAARMNRLRRVIRLDICLENVGRAPAEDIEVFMHFPDGFALCKESDRPKPPEKPKPPSPPRGPFDLMRGLSGAFSAGALSPSPDLSQIPSASPSNVSSPSIEKTNSYDVKFGARKLKQHLSETFDPLYVVFHSYETASFFQIDYRINAANLPKEVEGQLNVIIKKD